MYHELTRTDYSGSFRETDTWFFATPEDALNFASSRGGDFYGMYAWKLDGKTVNPDDGHAGQAAEPIGYRHAGTDYFYEGRAA